MRIPPYYQKPSWQQFFAGIRDWRSDQLVYFFIYFW